MGDQIFNTRKGKRKIRKEKQRKIEIERYLIVCEGKKTEVLYFEGIIEKLKEHNIDKINLEHKKFDRITVEGTGKNTESLISCVEKLVRKAAIPYGQIWCVFDKDSFSDEQFNNAIMQAESKGYNVAWSNECFELWFILHFDYLQSAISRKEYFQKIDKIFKEKNINNGIYEKNIEDIFKILEDKTNVAIKNSNKLLKLHEDNGLRTCSAMKPATKVHVLVGELLSLLKR